MRAALAAVLTLAACSVPDKDPATPDAGADARPTDAVVDDVAPDTTITSAPAEFSREGTATFEFVSDDPDATFECGIDGDTPVTCASPYSRALGDGAHTFTVRAIDQAGNSDDTPAEHVWSIDRVPPETTITDRPPAADNSVTVTFAFEADEDNVSFDCSLDGGSYAPCASGDDFGPLGDGAHSFAVRATDRAGNVDASPAIDAWSVDTSTPDTQLLSGPSGATASSSASFTFVSPDAGAGATFQCSLDAGPFTTCTSPKNYAGLGMGDHDFAVRVRDAVGNLDPTPATRSWTVDLTDPNTTITAGPSGLVAAASASFTFTSNETGATFECSDDGGTFIACTSPHSRTGLAQGAHSFAVRAIDAALHVDQTPAMRSWTVDTVAPDVTFIAGPGPDTISGPRVVFGFTASDGVIGCSLDGAPFIACASPRGYNLPAGAHELIVRAVDPAGNTGTAPRAWTVACAAPDAAGAAGVLHLDLPDQAQVNAVAGGADATLGGDLTVEPADPAPMSPARFDRGLAFTAAEGDHVSWPVALTPMSDITIELWVRPDSLAGDRDLVVNNDGRIALRVSAASPTTVRFSITILRSDGVPRVLNSAVVAAGQWHHVLASLDAPSLRMWVDGVRTETVGAQLGGGPPGLASLGIGGGGGTAYSGDLDEVWIAQTAIVDNEVALARYCPP